MHGSLAALTSFFITLHVSNCLDNAIQNVFYLENNFDLNKEFPSNHFEGTFPVFSVLPRCKTSELIKCHDNGKDAKAYFSYCFDTKCTLENYYCIDTLNSTLHFCANLGTCGIRQRRIVVFNPETAYVKIYRVKCPDGRYQESLDKCTYRCTKDDSIVLYKLSTATSSAKAYCSTKMDMCNPHNETVFEIGSDKDECVIASVSCYPKELLPDCSCAEPCAIGQTRNPESKFRCTISSMENADTTETTKHGTGQETLNKGVDDIARKEGEDNTKNTSTTEKNDSYQPQSGINVHSDIIVLIVTIVVVLIIIAIVLLVGLGCFIYHKRRNNNQCHSTNVHVWKNVKQIIKNTFKIRTEQNVDIRAGEEESARDSLDSQRQSDISEQSPDQRLLGLKAHHMNNSSRTRQKSTDSETEVLKLVN